VLPNGDLVNIFDLISNSNEGALQGLNVTILRSTDRGETWSQQPIIVSKLGTIGVTDPESGDDVRTADIIPDIAVDPKSGRLYAVWQDARFNGNQADTVAFSQSRNGGLTWSTPIKINKTPTNIPIGNQQAFTPSVHVASNGAIGVTYYDFRNNTPETPLLTDYFILHCHPTSPTACTSAGNWTGEKKLTNVSFDMRQAPDAQGLFTGDYEGLSAAGKTFLPFFSQPHNGDPSSTFFRRVAQ
jgi:hypothetical protein